METASKRKGHRHTGRECRQTTNQTESEQGTQQGGVKRGKGLTDGERQLNTSQLLFCFKGRQ